MGVTSVRKLQWSFPIFTLKNVCLLNGYLYEFAVLRDFPYYTKRRATIYRYKTTLTKDTQSFSNWTWKQQIKQQCKGGTKKMKHRTTVMGSVSPTLRVKLISRNHSATPRTTLRSIENKAIYIDNVNSIMYMNSKSLQSKSNWICPPYSD